MKWWKLVLIIGLAGLVVWFLKQKYREIPVFKVSIREEHEKAIGEEEIRIALVADIHNDWEELARAVERIKETTNELIIVVGDMTIYGRREELVEAKKKLEGSGLSYAVVPGNHDAYRKMAGKYIYDEIFGKRYQVIKRENLKLILIDNSGYEGLGMEQWNWVEKEVAECQKILCLAVMHMPLNNNFSKHLMGENNTKVTVEARNLLKLLVDNGVRQIEAGHLHYASSYELEGIRTDIVGAISRERNTQSPRYTELVIRGDEIERKVVEVDK